MHETVADAERKAPRATFVYTTYIRSTPETLWTALTSAECMKRYWFGMHCESRWTVGAAWRRLTGDGCVVDVGEVIAIEPLRRMVIRWRHEKHPELRAEGDSLCTMELSDLEPGSSVVKLTITHTVDRDPSKLIEAVSEGWPKVAANLKSLLETGAAIMQER